MRHCLCVIMTLGNNGNKPDLMLDHFICFLVDLCCLTRLNHISDSVKLLWNLFPEEQVDHENVPQQEEH